ncbi:MAG: hypothetical protein IMZ61_00895, partial [Planctomycetes bacterium]|nr:hypothetical protein [Planctomycetota bacterium]
PIGRKIKTACLNLGELGYFGNQLPADIDDLTRRTEQVAHQVITRYQLPVEITDAKTTDLSTVKIENLKNGYLFKPLYASPNGPLFHFDFYDIAVDYGDTPAIQDNVPKSIRLKIWNRYKVQANLSVRWLAPESWQITPARQGAVFVGCVADNPRELTFTLQTPRVEDSLVRLAVELTVEARTTSMLVPITLVNGNF